MSLNVCFDVCMMEVPLLLAFFVGVSGAPMAKIGFGATYQTALKGGCAALKLQAFSSICGHTTYVISPQE